MKNRARAPMKLECCCCCVCITPAGTLQLPIKSKRRVKSVHDPPAVLEAIKVRIDRVLLFDLDF